MNIAIITTWFPAGGGYVSKAYKQILEKEHNVFIYARDGQLMKGDLNIEIKKELTSHLFDIKSNYDDYQQLILKSNVRNGMPFELNTTLFWNVLATNSIKEIIKIYIYKAYICYKIR